MSRKHFVALARALRDSGASQDVVSAVASELAAFNPNFDRARFIDAATSEVSA